MSVGPLLNFPLPALADIGHRHELHELQAPRVTNDIRRPSITRSHLAIGSHCVGHWTAAANATTERQTDTASSGPMGNGQSSAPRQAAVSASGPYSEFAGFTYHERLARSEFDRMFPPLIYPGETPPNSTNRTLDSHDDAPAPVPAPPSPDPGQRKLFSSRKTRESQCVAAVLLENPPADQPSCSVCLTAVSTVGHRNSAAQRIGRGHGTLLYFFHSD